MSRTLRLRIVEDSENDLQLLLREVRHSGYEVVYECVDNAQSIQSALEKTIWDIVISDYSLPRFSAPEALAVVKRCEINMPFIIVSGSVEEETYVAYFPLTLARNIKTLKLTKVSKSRQKG